MNFDTSRVSTIQMERVLDRAVRSLSLNIMLGALGAARSVGTEILVTQEVHTNGTVQFVGIQIAHNSLEPSNIRL
jgi:hypothetical protein